MAGSDIRSRFAGHASRGAQTRHALRLKQDHLLGAGRLLAANAAAICRHFRANSAQCSAAGIQVRSCGRDPPGSVRRKAKESPLLRPTHRQIAEFTQASARERCRLASRENRRCDVGRKPGDRQDAADRFFAELLPGRDLDGCRSQALEELGHPSARIGDGREEVGIARRRIAGPDHDVKKRRTDVHALKQQGSPCRTHQSAMAPFLRHLDNGNLVTFMAGSSATKRATSAR